jgi:hypothetical protein
MTTLLASPLHAWQRSDALVMWQPQCVSQPHCVSQLVQTARLPAWLTAAKSVRDVMRDKGRSDQPMFTSDALSANAEPTVLLSLVVT